MSEHLPACDLCGHAVSVKALQLRLAERFTELACDVCIWNALQVMKREGHMRWSAALAKAGELNKAMSAVKMAGASLVGPIDHDVVDETLKRIEHESGL